MIACAPCEHATAHGWWGPDHQGTHCRDCHRSWRGKAEAHCAACHESFGSVSSFEIHVRYCTADPQTAQESLRVASRDDGTPRLALQDRNGGPVWVSWRSEGNPYA